MHGIEVLVVDDDRRSLDKLERLLTQEGYGVSACLSEEEAKNRLGEKDFDLVLVDVGHRNIDELAVLDRVKEVSPNTEVIILTAAPTVQTAVEAMKKGAFHYLSKPFNDNQFQLVVKNALDKRILRLEVQELRGIVTHKGYLNDLIGKNPKMQQLKKEIGRVAPMDCPVLVQGETGTGKEMVSRIIHRMSYRAEQKFLAVNCGSLNEEILSNELFGHEKEAFTGAQRVKQGVFEAISGGVLLLDEIGEMPHSMQVQLLRVLQEKTVIRVGGTQEVPVDVRVLAATNKNLRKQIAAGRFREDLYYRLNVFTLRIPPLRERKDDIPLFCRYFLEKYAKTFQKNVEEISEEAMELFFNYSFPGNVRELENIVERAVILADGRVVTPGHLPRRVQEAAREEPGPERETQRISLAEMEKRHIRDVLRSTRG
ncbi:MAG: sigma-54 dependent transcriptional regulator, partial [Desulfohalobiaceae bacterium]|nr:sigma-54 dependent transcriptional regulator [Desulfohalobiaceae bacterium]